MRTKSLQHIILTFALLWLGAGTVHAQRDVANEDHPLLRRAAGSRIADKDKGEAIKRFLDWMLTEGQAMAAPLNYAPLPPAVVEMEKKALDRITVGGTAA